MKVYHCCQGISTFPCLAIKRHKIRNNNFQENQPDLMKNLYRLEQA